jgi:hypothetical protein
LPLLSALLILLFDSFLLDPFLPDMLLHLYLLGLLHLWRRTATIHLFGSCPAFFRLYRLDTVQRIDGRFARSHFGQRIAPQSFGLVQRVTLNKRE